MGDEAVVLVTEVGGGGRQVGQRVAGVGATGDAGDVGHEVAPRRAGGQVAAVTLGRVVYVKRHTREAKVGF